MKEGSAIKGSAVLSGIAIKCQSSPKLSQVAIVLSIVLPLSLGMKEWFLFFLFQQRVETVTLLVGKDEDGLKEVDKVCHLAYSGM